PRVPTQGLPSRSSARLDMAGLETLILTTALLSQRNNPPASVPTNSAPSRSSNNTDGLKLARSPALSGIISPDLTGSAPSLNLRICCPAQIQMPPECAAVMRN